MSSMCVSSRPGPKSSIGVTGPCRRFLQAANSEGKHHRGQERHRYPQVIRHPIDPGSRLGRRRSRRRLGLRRRCRGSRRRSGRRRRRGRLGRQQVAPGSGRAAVRPHSAEASAPRPSSVQRPAAARGAGAGGVAGVPSLCCSALSSALRISISRFDSASCPSNSLTRSLSACESAFAAFELPAVAAAAVVAADVPPPVPGVTRRKWPPVAAAIPPALRQASIWRCTSPMASF